MESEHFGDLAPISEALIDIQVTLPPSVTEATLKALHRKIEADYPQARARRRWESAFSINDSGESSRSDSIGVDGWLFTSRDGKQVAQFRLDGFSANRLRPYERWEGLRDEARRLWEVYRDAVQPSIIRRVALRYINRLRIPLAADLDRYLTAGPRIPSVLPQQFHGFLTQIELPDLATGATATISQALESESSSSSNTIVLDIDVARGDPIDPSSSDLWGSLESLRTLKNRLFFASITEETRDLIRSGGMR